MSLEEWADLHGEDYPKGKFFSALDYGRGDRTCTTIYCDYCEQPFEIKEDELDDWIVIDPVSGDKVVMCGECENRRTQRALDRAARCPNCSKPWDKFFCAECGYCKPPRQ